MYYPQLETSSASRDFQEVFNGYNHNLRISEGEFYDMKNMTGDYYPVLSPRNKRGISKIHNENQKMDSPNGLICKDALCYVDGHSLYINGYKQEHIMLDDNKKTLVSMGAYLIIFPDGIYINTEKTADWGYINQENTIECTNNRYISYTMCSADGNDYKFTTSVSKKPDQNEVYVSSEAPNTSNLVNGYKWLDTSGDVHYIKVWSATNSMWSSVSTTYIKLNCSEIGVGFKEGDAVQIKGCKVTNQGDTVKEQINALNTNIIIKSIEKVEEGKSPSWIVVTGILDKICQQKTGTVTISRKAPKMDFIVESNNRLWGCFYGMNYDTNETINEIYACKQGDFKNWFCYAGISTDSYAASVGSDGVWTGAIPYGNYIMFFKENCIHKVYGNMPSNYQIIEQKVRGVQRGSEKSLCVVNETLFYKSASEVCYYDGSLPVGISNALGEVRYSNAVGGSINNKYYISLQSNSGEWSMFVYDIAKQIWHKEDNTHAQEFCRVNETLYYIDADTNELKTVTGEGDLGVTYEDDFEWFAETGEIGYSYSDNKYVGRMLLRIQKPLTTKIFLYIKYDDMNDWEAISAIGGIGTRSYSLPVTPRRCDHFKLRIEGKGDCKIYSLSKVLEIGSDA